MSDRRLPLGEAPPTPERREHSVLRELAVDVFGLAQHLHAVIDLNGALETRLRSAGAIPQEVSSLLEKQRVTAVAVRRTMERILQEHLQFDEAHWEEFTDQSYYRDPATVAKLDQYVAQAAQTFREELSDRANLRESEGHDSK